MKERVLVLGSAGLIGHQVYNYLKIACDYELFNLSHSNKIQNDTILLDARNEKALTDQIKIIRPKKTILTNMHTDLDYDKLKNILPKNIVPGYDGMTITL